MQAVTKLQRQHALQAIYHPALVPYVQHSLCVCGSELAFQSSTAAQVADFDIVHHTDARCCDASECPACTSSQVNWP